MNDNTIIDEYGHMLKLVSGIVLVLLYAGCSTDVQSPMPPAIGSATSSGPGAAVIDVSIERLEVIHFHGHNQCASCIAVGALAEETVSTYFSDEVASGKVSFAHVNAQLPENAALAEQYGITGSSLWIGVYRKDGSFDAEQNINVWYKISDKPAYLEYLKGVIEAKLAGK